MDRWLWHTLISTHALGVPVLSNTDMARVEVMLNMRLGHSVRPQQYNKINNTCANSTTLLTSFNEPLYRFTSKSMMLGCPS